jgi:hypothetical protein
MKQGTTIISRTIVDLGKVPANLPDLLKAASWGQHATCHAFCQNLLHMHIWYGALPPNIHFGFKPIMLILDEWAWSCPSWLQSVLLNFMCDGDGLFHCCCGNVGTWFFFWCNFHVATLPSP